MLCAVVASCKLLLQYFSLDIILQFRFVKKFIETYFCHPTAKDNKDLSSFIFNQSKQVIYIVPKGKGTTVMTDNREKIMFLGTVPLAWFPKSPFLTL